MWPNPQETADLTTFTEEIINGKLHFLCSDAKFKTNENTLHNDSIEEFLDELHQKSIVTTNDTANGNVAV